MFSTFITRVKSIVTISRHAEVSEPAAAPSAFAVRCQKLHGLSASDVSDLKEALAHVSGPWTVSEDASHCGCDADCHCDGMDVTVRLTREEGDPRSSIEFTIYPDGGFVWLDVGGIDGGTYYSQFWSVPAALAGMHSLIAEAERAEMSAVA